MDGLIPPADQQEANKIDTISSIPETASCTVSELKVDSQHNYFALDAEAAAMLRQTAVSVELQTGTQLIQFRDDRGDHRDFPAAREPVVMLWISGGRVINRRTGVAVETTWATLNGFDDTITLEVLEPSILRAFFLDTAEAEHSGQVEITIVRI